MKALTLIVAAGLASVGLAGAIPGRDGKYPAPLR